MLLALLSAVLFLVLVYHQPSYGRLITKLNKTVKITKNVFFFIIQQWLENTRRVSLLNNLLMLILFIKINHA